MNIKIYSSPTCPHCISAKKYFESKEIPFENIDVTASRDAATEMIKLSGQRGVPVIIIDQQTIIGFDKKKIENIIGQ